MLFSHASLPTSQTLQRGHLAIVSTASSSSFSDHHVDCLWSDQASSTIGPLSLLNRSQKRRHLQISIFIYFDLAELDLQLVSWVCDRVDVLNVKYNRNLMTVVLIFNKNEFYVTFTLWFGKTIWAFSRWTVVDRLMIWSGHETLVEELHLLPCICFRRKVWIFCFK